MVDLRLASDWNFLHRFYSAVAVLSLLLAIEGLPIVIVS